MFILQETPIDISLAKETSDKSGALVTFEGTVRADKINGRRVSELLYIADRPACIAEGKRIVEEAKEKFPIHEAACIQRIGRLKITECAIWIGVWAGHRDDAFVACRYIIEEVKKRLLIWKKEFYADGTEAWIHGKDKSASPLT